MSSTNSPLRGCLEDSRWILGNEYSEIKRQRVAPTKMIRLDLLLGSLIPSSSTLYRRYCRSKNRHKSFWKRSIVHRSCNRGIRLKSCRWGREPWWWGMWFGNACWSGFWGRWLVNVSVVGMMEKMDVLLVMKRGKRVSICTFQILIYPRWFHRMKWISRRRIAREPWRKYFSRRDILETLEKVYVVQVWRDIMGLNTRIMNHRFEKYAKIKAAPMIG